MGPDAVPTPPAQTSMQAAQTLTFLFTDLEGSPQLWERLPGSMGEALKRHDAIVGAAVAAFDGQVVKGTGDGFMAVFTSAADAVGACLDAQERLEHEPWGETGPLRVRMGLHSGVAETRAGDYYGPTVNRTARIMGAAHGGQVLLSASAAALVADTLPDRATLRGLGEHRLKNLGRPERIFQLVHPSLESDFPPLTAAARDHHLPTRSSAFVGREEELDEIGRRLTDGAVRLLTLVGPGGIGKTRLALRAAAGHSDRFEDGVFFVDLSPVRDPESVLTAIADSVGVREPAGQPLLGELTRSLRDQRALLVLNNFEQVISAGGDRR